MCKEKTNKYVSALSCMAVPFSYVNYRKSVRGCMPEGDFLGTSKTGGSLAKYPAYTYSVCWETSGDRSSLWISLMASCTHSWKVIYLNYVYNIREIEKSFFLIYNSLDSYTHIPSMWE